MQGATILLATHLLLLCALIPHFLFLSLGEEHGEGREGLVHKPEMFSAITAPWRYG